MNRPATAPGRPETEATTRTGVPWADGQFAVRVRGLGPEASRIVRVRRPFALIGRHPGADIRIEDRAAAPRHALLVLDRRGMFCVDLLSRTGTRFAGRDFGATWLGVGDSIEVAGRRLEVLQLRADGATIDPTPGDDDPLGPAGPDLAPVSLRPADPGAPPWVIASPLAFLGRGPACVVRVRGQAAAPIHCALWRDPSSVRVIDLHGRSTRVNDRPVEGSAPLEDGDVLTIGRARFVVGLEGFASVDPAAMVDPFEAEIVPSPVAPIQAPLPLRADETPAVVRTSEVDLADPDLAEVMDFLRQFQADAATLIEGQFDQINALRRELSALRDDLRGDRPAPPESHAPFRIKVPVNAGTSSLKNAAWLLDRINDLEPEARPSWKDLLGRISSAVKNLG